MHIKLAIRLTLAICLLLVSEGNCGDNRSLSQRIRKPRSVPAEDEVGDYGSRLKEKKRRIKYVSGLLNNVNANENENDKLDTAQDYDTGTTQLVHHRSPENIISSSVTTTMAPTTTTTVTSTTTTTTKKSRPRPTHSSKKEKKTSANHRRKPNKHRLKLKQIKKVKNLMKLKSVSIKMLQQVETFLRRQTAGVVAADVKENKQAATGCSCNRRKKNAAKNKQKNGAKQQNR